MSSILAEHNEPACSGMLDDPIRAYKGIHGCAAGPRGGSRAPRRSLGAAEGGYGKKRHDEHAWSSSTTGKYTDGLCAIGVQSDMST